MFCAGTLGHSRDFRQAAGGFIHGFRYAIRALHRILEDEEEGGAQQHALATDWPSERWGWDFPPAAFEEAFEKAVGEGFEDGVEEGVVGTPNSMVSWTFPEPALTAAIRDAADPAGGEVGAPAGGEVGSGGVAAEVAAGRGRSPSKWKLLQKRLEQFSELDEDGSGAVEQVRRSERHYNIIICSVCGATHILDIYTEK